MDKSPPASQQSPTGFRTVAQLPGPPAWPLVGHLLQFDEPRMHLQLEDWSRTYGPHYRLRFLRTDVLVVSDTDLVAQAFRARPDTWRRFGSIEPVAREAGVHGLFSAEGVEWERQRRLVTRAFDPDHLRRFVPRLQTVTDRLRRRWLRAARDSEVLDVQTELMRYAVDAVAGLAFGVDINTVEQEHNDLNSHLEKVLPMINRRLHAVFPYWRYLRLPADRAFDRNLAAIHGMLRELIAAAKEQLARDPALQTAPRNLLQALLVAADEGSSGDAPPASEAALTEDEVIGNLFTVLLAGQDTTANTLAWTIYLLLRIRRHGASWSPRPTSRCRQAGAPDPETAPPSPFAQACASRGNAPAPRRAIALLRSVSRHDIGRCLAAQGDVSFLPHAPGRDRPDADTPSGRVPARALARRRARRPAQATRDAVRRRTENLPWTQSGDAGDAHAALDARPQLRARRRTHRTPATARRAHGVHRAPGGVADAAHGAALAAERHSIARTTYRIDAHPCGDQG